MLHTFFKSRLRLGQFLLKVKTISFIHSSEHKYSECFHTQNLMWFLPKCSKLCKEGCSPTTLWKLQSHDWEEEVADPGILWPNVLPTKICSHGSVDRAKTKKENIFKNKQMNNCLLLAPENKCHYRSPWNPAIIFWSSLRPKSQGGIVYAK